MCISQKSLEQPKQMVVTDMEDIFVPLREGFLVDVNESKLVCYLLKSLINSQAEFKQGFLSSFEK